MTRAKTPSARARDLRAKHPDWSLARIADAVGISKQGVANALRATGKRGRPKGVAAKRSPTRVGDFRSPQQLAALGEG